MSQPRVRPVLGLAVTLRPFCASVPVTTGQTHERFFIFSWSFLRKLPQLCSILPGAALSVPAWIMVWGWEAALKPSEKPNKTTPKMNLRPRKKNMAAQQPWKLLLMLLNQINRYKIGAFPCKNRNKDAKLDVQNQLKPLCLSGNGTTFTPAPWTAFITKKG